MDYAAAAEALMRRKLLEGIYDRMTEDEKRLFVQMTMQRKGTDEILAALRQQQAQLDRLQKGQQTFAEDFASNIAGNAVWAGAVWLFAKLARILK